MITPELKKQLIEDDGKFSKFDCYLGNPAVKRDGVEQSYTQRQLDELIRCRTDPIHFCKSWLKVINLDRGLVDFDLYPYQEDMIGHFENNRFSIVLACRQSGKSVSSVGYLLWKAISTPDMKIGILANKGSTAKEMLARITLMLENVPFFLQPGCKTLNKSHIHFSNNSEIRAESTSSNSIRGFAMNLIYLDEFAFVQDAATFYTSTYPVISSGQDSRVIITSTANGIGNQYYKLWEGANQKTNSYKPFRVDWWDVPGRDEAWKEETIANTSQLQFDQEFGNCLAGNSTVIIRFNDQVRKITLESLYDAISRNGQDGFSINEEIEINSKSIERIWITYKITHKDSGKFYVGKTSLDRWESGYMGSSKIIQNAISKYGKEAFDRTILSYHDNENDAYLSEELTLDECLHDELCYNIAGGGKGVGSGKNHPFFGKTQTTKSNKLRSKALKGQKRSKAAIENYKKAWTPERRKMQAAIVSSKPGTMSGKKHKEESKIKISEASSGKNNAFYGKTHRKETCPHCNKSGAWFNMQRWHFDNCKEKK